MKKLAILALTASALVLGGVSSIKLAKNTTEARDATIIVRMTTDIHQYSEDQLLNIQNSLLNEISTSLTSNFRVTSRYTNIFNGFVLEVPSTYVDDIRHLNRVDKVNYNIMLDEEVVNNDGARYDIQLTTSKKTASAQTMEKPDGTNDGSGIFVAILDTSFYIQTSDKGKQTYHNVFAPLQNAEDVVITQASLKAKIDAAKNFHGKYDKDHSTYYNSKVPFYYDYGGDQSAATVPDYDVYADGQEHGTHVASIAGGNAGEEYEGIAPRSQMALMKVFRTYMSGDSYQSGAPNDAVLNALEDCLVLGVDTLNMSLGSNLNDFDDAEIVQDVIRELDKNGTFVNVAAGNEGKEQYSGTVYKYWSTDMVETNILSSYANNGGAMTVASTQADFQFYGEALTVGDTNIQFYDQVTNYRTVEGEVTYKPERHLKDLLKDEAQITEFDYVYLPGLGKIEEYADVDVTGKIVVTNRGDITFKEKVDNAVAKGAIAILIIDNTNSTEFNFRMNFSKDEPYNPAIPVCSVLNRDKEVFENAVEKGVTKLKFLLNVDLDNPTARVISDYSSDGMRYDLAIKPEIATPGENIKGAVLGEVNKYESFSGTSMATPNFTGSVALMLGEHLGDADYRGTIKSRLMSTATPMKDNVPDATYGSVRRQGAGLVNLDAALNSKVYLDGIDGEGNQIGKAKIELYNNEKIAQGKLDLSFMAINEGDKAVTYTATTYVLAPATEEYSEELYPEFAGQKFQTVQDQLVEKFTDTVTVPANSKTKITLPEHQVSEANLAKLDEDFENGCILEGYVILTAENQHQLSIPYLGFYGNLDNMSPVEPFGFEKEDGKTYDSDILNYFLNISIGKASDGSYDYSKADFSSQIVTGYWKTNTSVSLSNVVNNSTGLSRITDESGNRVNLVGTNPFNGELTNELYVGNNGYSNTMIIQQYVRRSVRDNTLTLTNKATNEVILTDHMFDMLMGSEYDEATGITTYPLYKSHLDATALFDSGYMAHRAYSVIPLYKTESGKQVNYPDGEYEMKFSYELMSGGHYEVSYTLHIESELPAIRSIEKVDNAYRFHYTDTNLAVLYVAEKPYAPTKEEGGVYVDVPTSVFEKSDKAYITSEDKSFGKETFITHVDDQNSVMLYNKFFNTNYDFDYEIKGKGKSQTLTFNITKGTGAGSTSGNIIYRMLVPKGIDINTLKVYTVDAKGNEKEIKYTIIGNYVQFETPIRIIHLVSEKSAGGSGCGGSLIASSAVLSIVAALGATLLFMRKRKED